MTWMETWIHNLPLPAMIISLCEQDPFPKNLAQVDPDLVWFGIIVRSRIEHMIQRHWICKQQSIFLKRLKNQSSLVLKTNKDKTNT